MSGGFIKKLVDVDVLNSTPLYSRDGNESALT